MRNWKIWVGAAAGSLAAVVVVVACGPSSTGSESTGSQSQEVVQLPANGNVSTIAGTGAPGAADNAVATSGTLNDPTGVAVASDGSIFVADWMNNSVRRISSTGALSTVAKGSPNLIRNPRGEASGATGAIPVPQWNAVGTWSQATRTNGCVDPCPSPFDGSKWISGVKSGAASTLTQVIDLSAYRTAIAASRISGAFSAAYRGGGGTVGARIKVEYLDTNGVARTTFDSGLLPGNNTSNSWLSVSDQRPISSLVFSARITLSTDFPFDTGFDGLQLRMIDSMAGVNDRLLSGPAAVAISSTGELWIGANGLWRGDTGGVGLTKITDVGGYVAPKRVSGMAALSDGYIYTVEPTATKLHVRSPGGVGYYANSTTTWTDQIVAVAGIDQGATHRIYVAFRNSAQIGVYTCAKSTVFTTAACAPNGTIGVAARGFVDDMDATAGGQRFGFINGLAVGKFGDLFIAEESNHAIRRTLLPLTQTSAGNGVAGFVEGVSTAARFSSPSSVAVMPNGNVIVADRLNNRIRSISCAGINVCGTAVAGCVMTPTDDANGCTTDTCMTLAVNHVPVANGSSCSDNNLCTLVDTCNGGACQPGARKEEDNNACTTDTCNPSTGIAVNTPISAADNNACTVDSCVAPGGTFLHVAVNVDDNNACTTDACNTTTGVISHTPISTADNNACTIDACDAASGVSHLAIPIDDGNACTSDTCNPVTGPSHTPLVIPPSPDPLATGQCDPATGQILYVRQPPAPSLSAPVLAGGGGTPLGDQTKFIYSGANPVQTGLASASTIDPKHAAWIIGQAKDDADANLSGVKVSVAGQLKYGSTLTRADGRFDLVVNGGSHVTIRFEKTGYLTVDRQVYAGWAQTSVTDPVVLLKISDSLANVLTNAGSQMQVAVGASEDDGDGERAPLLMLPASTTATKIVGGSVQPLPAQYTLRATEYTVGANGPARMPAALPPTSGYTYAVELSVDEASDATQVNFSKTAYFYLENFIGAPVGSVVPAGYYDRAKQSWIASDNGYVIQITGVDAAGRAIVNTGGAPITLSPEELKELGNQINDERYVANQKLWRIPINHLTPFDFNWAWESDCENPCVPPPPPPPRDDDKPECQDTAPGSIIGCQSQTLGETHPVPGTPFSLNYNSQRAVGEDGAAGILYIGLPEASPPAARVDFEIEVAIAGRSWTYAGNNANLASNRWRFVWQGLDAAGRAVVGSTTATITYRVWAATSLVATNRFGDPRASQSSSWQFTRMASEPTAVYRTTRQITGRALARSGPWAFGGWTLSDHHFYDVKGRQLYLGTGEVVNADPGLLVSQRILGDGKKTSLAMAFDGASALTPGTGINATTGSLVAEPNGDILVGDNPRGLVRRINANPSVCVGGTDPNDHCIRTVASGVGSVGGLALGPDGSLYISSELAPSYSQGMIYRAAPDALGGFNTPIPFAGAGGYGFAGDGGPAVAAKIHWPMGIAAGPDGSVYFADFGNCRIRRIDTGGVITTVAGIDCSETTYQSGMLATTQPIRAQYLAVTKDGGIYFTQGFYRIGYIGGDGILNWINAPSSGLDLLKEGIPLSTADALNAQSIAVKPNGAFVYEDYRSNLRDVIREVDAGGLVRTRSRGSSDVTSIDGWPSLQAGPAYISALAVAPDDTTLVMGGTAAYKLMEPSGPSTAACGANAMHLIPAGDEGYCFDERGVHLATIYLRTGKQRLVFNYDVNGSLDSIKDANSTATNGRLTDISPVTGGYQITAPGGQKTEISVNVDDVATKIEDSTASVQLDASPGGLLNSLTDARGNKFSFFYDSDMRLRADMSPIGTQSLERVSLTDGYRVTHKTPYSRQTTYEETVLNGGLLSTTLRPDGGLEQREVTLDRKSVVTRADGVKVTSTIAPDPRFGMRKPVLLTSQVDYPGAEGLSLARVLTHTASLSAGTWTETKTNALGSDAAAKVVVTSSASGAQVDVTTPAGRKLTKTVDAFGRVAKLQIGSLTPTNFAYETSEGSEHFGKLKSTSQGARVSTFDYQDKGSGTAPADAGYLLRVTTPGGATKFNRDLFGRVLTLTEAESAGSTLTGVTSTTWDANGNLATLAPPPAVAGASAPQHLLGYDTINSLVSYTPPMVPGVFEPTTLYLPNGDRQLVKTTLPRELEASIAAKIERRYFDTTGQLDTIAASIDGLAAGSAAYEYFSASNANGSAVGRVKTSFGSDGVDTSYLYNGNLVSKVSWSGSVVGTVAWTYSPYLRPKSETVTPTAGAVSASVYYFSYDQDGLLTCASKASPATCNPLVATDLKIARSDVHGMATSVTTGTLGEQLTYSDTAEDLAAGVDAGFGELRGQTLTGTPGGVLAQIVYDAAAKRRDALGRIRFKTEMFSGITNDLEYQYDARDRLKVSKGPVTETFGYDLNGNRTTYTPTTGGVDGATLIGKYDDQSRLLSYGTASGTAVGDQTFAYGPNGELKGKSVRIASGSEDWSFSYNPFGSLTRVSKPSWRYTYLSDAQGRRVAKQERFNSNPTVTTKKWLYRDGLSPVAELDSNGALVARFVYGTRPNVPDLVVRPCAVDPTICPTGTNTYRLFVDQLGSPRMAVNVAKSTDVPYRVDYSAFGVPTWKGTGAAATENFAWIPFGFAGGLYDKDTKLLRFGARDYDPQLGRWLSKDPIRFAGGQANLYTYSYNDPVNFVDETGRNVVAVAAWVGIAVVTVIAFIVYDDTFLDSAQDAEDSGLPGRHNGRQDAYRHCLASCYTSATYGDGFSNWAANWHENGGANPPDERRMDQHNNACGQTLSHGVLSDPWNECRAACLSEANPGGKLQLAP